MKSPVSLIIRLEILNFQTYLYEKDTFLCNFGKKKKLFNFLMLIYKCIPFCLYTYTF